MAPGPPFSRIWITSMRMACRTSDCGLVVLTSIRGGKLSSNSASCPCSCSRWSNALSSSGASGSNSGHASGVRWTSQAPVDPVAGLSSVASTAKTASSRRRMSISRCPLKERCCLAICISWLEPNSLIVMLRPASDNTLYTVLEYRQAYAKSSPWSSS
eukprot:CAMPEP_0180426320 /NCGR_PEP_ID=MMETSP1036_2-20121128/5736_1 /TAXON_ID=632150 /ORGANISM="Azadinium spinosum, Strain 3D9" /LENGTH=157 /DNA_ID=CAMNT_0022431873 /DNA_START=242 /DNA_END=715 /DNA_ORIENTATION=-